MNRAPLDYDAADDGMRSYYDAIAFKKARGDDYYLRQPDDPGVEPVEIGPFSARLILLCALAGLAPVAVLGAFLWLVTR